MIAAYEMIIASADGSNQIQINLPLLIQLHLMEVHLNPTSDVQVEKDERISSGERSVKASTSEPDERNPHKVFRVEGDYDGGGDPRNRRYRTGILCDLLRDDRDGLFLRLP